jgi:hypothetical protein
MLIKVLGSGCKNCQALEQSTRDAVAELGVNAEIDHVTDYPTIASYGVMSTPRSSWTSRSSSPGECPPPRRSGSCWLR